MIAGAQSSQRVAFGQKKIGTPNPMSGAAKLEHSLVAGSLVEIFTPRLAPEVHMCQWDF